MGEGGEWGLSGRGGWAREKRGKSKTRPDTKRKDRQNDKSQSNFAKSILNYYLILFHFL
jgi:hypothetical protein